MTHPSRKPQSGPGKQRARSGSEKTSGKGMKKTGMGMNSRAGLYFAGILLLTIIVYAKSLSGMILHWDDNTYILENTFIHKLDAAHIKEIFTSFYAFNYHPLTTLSWAMEYAIVKDHSSLLYHFDNLLLHLLNTLLVFWFIRLLSKKNSVALLVALLHAIHPAHVESVAWISERKDMLYGFFFLFSLGLYVQYLQEQLQKQKENQTGRGNTTKYIFSLLLFLGSLLSKSAAVVLPIVLLLLDYLLGRKITWKMFLEKIPFFALSILFGILALRSQQEAINSDTHYSFFQSILIVNHTVIRYLAMVFLPVQLCSFHPWPLLSDHSLPLFYYISPVISLLILFTLVYSLKKTKLPAFGILFFIVNLSLVLQVIPVGEAVMAERYTYIPFLGIFYVAAEFLVWFYENPKRTLSWAKPAVVILLIAGSVFFSFASVSRVKVWQQDRDLWNDMINQYPNSAFKAYLNRSKFRSEQHDMKGAYEDLSRLVQAKKYYSEALSMRGMIRSDSGNYSGAMRDFDEAIKFDSTYYLAYNNRGATRMRTQDMEGALNDFNRSIESKNDYYLSWFNRGAVRISLKKYKDAIADFDQALNLVPGYCEAMFAKGVAWADSGVGQSALSAYDDALRCNARYLDAYTNRGNIKLELNDVQGALQDFSTVLQIDPGNYLAYFNRAKLKIRTKDFKTAHEDLSRCVSLNPGNPSAYANLGSCSFNTGDKATACSEWNQGARLGNGECMQFINLYCK